MREKGLPRCKVVKMVFEHEWRAWGDSNARPLPWQSSCIWFYNNLEERGDCQTTRKSYKTSHSVGQVVGWTPGKTHGRLRSVGVTLVLPCQPPIISFLDRETKR